MDNEKIQLEIQTKKKKLEELRLYTENVKEKEKLESEERALLNKLHQHEVVQKYPKLFAFTRAWANFWKGLFKGIGSFFTGAGKALAKSDKFIAEQELKDNEHKVKMLKQELKQSKPKGILEEAGDID